MEIMKPKCRLCDGVAVGTVDIIYGIALMSPENDDDPKTFQYMGTTDVNWDSQKPIADKRGRSKLICANGHTWFSKIREVES